LRLTEDPAPRILYCFEEDDNGKINASELVRKVQVSDIDPSEIVVGGKITEGADIKELEGIRLHSGIKASIDEFKAVFKSKLH
jgi:CRISPR-associated protein Cst2